LFARTVKCLAVCSILVASSCVSYAKHAQTADELNKTKDELNSTTGQLQAAEDQLVDSSNQRKALEDRAAMADKLQAQNAELTAMIEKMKKDGAIATVDGTVLFTKEGMYGYRAQGDVLFSAGSDTLTTEGKKILKGVATELKKNNDPIVVIGHTDSDPIVRTADKWPRGNIQLGAGRAMSVSEYLVSEGIPETRISIQSCGPNQPVVTGTSTDAKSKNRRVEIMVRAGAGAPPSNTTTGTGTAATAGNTGHSH
jgi:outer membrane protein OmpA-like peptidoglycan-associated protein